MSSNNLRTVTRKAVEAGLDEFFFENKDSDGNVKISVESLKKNIWDYFTKSEAELRNK